MHHHNTIIDDDPHALPNAIEIFEADQPFLPSGWYWWYCLPGCLPDTEPIGPFDSEDEALADAREDHETGCGSGARWKFSRSALKKLFTVTRNNLSRLG